MGLDDSLFVLWETALLRGIEVGRKTLLLVVCNLWQVADHQPYVYACWDLPWSLAHTS